MILMLKKGMAEKGIQGISHKGPQIILGDGAGRTTVFAKSPPLQVTEGTALEYQPCYPVCYPAQTSTPGQSDGAAA